MIPYNSINQYLGVSVELTYADAMKLTSDELRDLLFTKKVLVFKKWNKLTPTQLGAFANKFGTRWTYEQYNHIKEAARYDTTGKAYTIYADTSYERLFAGIPWHVDIANEQGLPRYPARLLYCVDLPSDFTGLTTDISNLAAAYDNLPDHSKTELEQIYYVYQSWQKPGTNIKDLPAIETHPYTKQKFIRLNAVGTENGWIRAWYRLNDDGTKTWLNNETLKNIVSTLSNTYQYSHQWEIGDLVLWDNWATIHRKGPGSVNKDSVGGRGFYRLSVDTGLDDIYCNDNINPE